LNLEELASSRGKIRERRIAGKTRDAFDLFAKRSENNNQGGKVDQYSAGAPQPSGQTQPQGGTTTAATAQDTEVLVQTAVASIFGDIFNALAPIVIPRLEGFIRERVSGQSGPQAQATVQQVTVQFAFLAPLLGAVAGPLINWGVERLRQAIGG
jgi:hypothetical protein